MIHLRGNGLDAIVEVSDGTPRIVHWGTPLDDRDLEGIAEALDRPTAHGSPDAVAPASVVPEHGAGWPGRPGLLGHRRRGAHWAPRFTPNDHHVADTGEGQRLTVVARDEVAALTMTTIIEVADAMVVRAELRNDQAADRYLLDQLALSLPVPQHAAELATFTGRWTREFHPTRTPWPHGSHIAENRRGRTSHEHPPLLFTGTPGFGEWSGEVWGTHLAWSGNHAWLAERLADGRRHVQMGELLHPGEISLEPGESYLTPELIAVWSDAGLTPATQRFHRHLRARPAHPTSPRPVLVNTWEAVYFDHDLDTLRALADRAARVGVERFVLDDGWFGSRRDDTSGLGDWVVSPDIYPDGLGPLVEHVTGLGMEFGIWVEPEMVNPDSDLFRVHPEWALATDGYEPPLGRHQLVLDLSNEGAYRHVFDQLDALLRDHEISSVKWDMNRDHIAASDSDGSASTHAQTLALYRLLDELRDRHPDVEFESCSSGGGRIDHEILRRTERVWTSDCNDALERQTIQRGASMLIPPEVMGAHIGPSRSHTTGRRHRLAFRAAGAVFGHLGIEWNLLDLDDRALDGLADVIALHKRFRPLLHGGDVVRFDTESAFTAHGVYAPGRDEAVVSFARLTTSTSLIPPPLQLPGLDADISYRVEHLPLPGGVLGPVRELPAWWETGAVLSGRALSTVGLQLPPLHPESAVLLHLVAV